MEEALIPFDITGIPLFPYVPDLYEWLYLFVAFACALILIKYLALTHGRQKPVQPACKLAIKELKKIQSGSLSQREALFEASLIIRRLLSILENKPADSLTANELRKWAEITDQLELSDLVEILIEVDSLKFNQELNDKTNGTLLTELIESLEKYCANKELEIS